MKFLSRAGTTTTVAITHAHTMGALLPRFTPETRSWQVGGASAAGHSDRDSYELA
jgi:hypothetical protein